MRYHNITKDDMLNGEGLRSVLWVAGCTHGCEGCHNKETWSLHGGLAFDEEAKAELFASLDNDYTCGVTLSGGDPLHLENRSDITALAKELKEIFPTKTIWLYTGYAYADVMDLEVMQYVDVLIDGKFEQTQISPNLPWVGSSNQNIIDVQLSKQVHKLVLYKEIGV